MDEIRLGLLGCGTVGGGVVRLLAKNEARLNARVGKKLRIVRALVRDEKKERASELPDGVLTTRAEDVLGDDSLDVIVEVMGGADVARDYVLSAIRSKKQVVTANKMLLALHGAELVSEVPGVAAKLLDHPGIAVFFKPHVDGMARVDHPLIQTVCRYTSEGSACLNDMQLQPGSFVPLPGYQVPWVTLAACVGKPRGVGRIRFTSGYVQDAPILETALLTDEEDRRMAREAFVHIGRLARTKALSSLARPIWPSSNPWDAEGNYRHELTRMCGSGYHPSGTAPMGKDSDPMAALDERGEVRGVRDLYVCDASAMPTIPSANTHFPTLMMGERFASFLA